MKTTENIQWHSLSIEETFEKLKSSKEGLSDSEAKERLEKYGKNELEDKEKVSVIKIIWKEINNPLIYLLLAASIVSILTDHIIDAGVIFAIVILNTAMGTWQEYRAEEAISALKQLTSPKAKVLRDGEEKEIENTEVVPGDIIIAKSGDKISADARLIKANELETDESIFTGESESVAKGTEKLKEGIPVSEKKNMVWMSTTVTNGKARAIVVATGMKTETGKIAAKVSETEREKTPLQKKLNKLGKYIGGGAVFFAGAIFVAGYLMGYDTIEMLLYSVAAAVSAIPEGLPAVISITLAIGIRRMAARKSIIRRLPAVETLGSTTVICSDKTGTITKNEMTVIRIFSDGKIYKITGEGYNPEGKFTPEDDKDENINDEMPESLEKLLQIGTLANDSKLKKAENERWSIEGAPTEGAILVASEKAGSDYKKLRKEKERIAEIPFSSKRKYMATLHKDKKGNNIFVKGAPETILDFCSKYFEGNKVKDLTEEKRKELNKINEELAGEALRVIAGAFKETDKSELSKEDVEKDLIFAGFWGIMDPPREEAIDAIKKCKDAGIRVIMMTGDNSKTASAIASQVQISQKDDETVTGNDIEKMEDNELEKKIEKVNVFARVTPSHKLKILKALKAKGEIVAMTGDGVNDAPSLKGADIGVAMGQSGTDVAKEASDMVLTDDNFATIVNAIEEGRLIFNNLRNVIFFLVTTNLGEIILLTSAIIFNLPLPLTAVMILWVNLVTDGPFAPAIGVEPKHYDLLKDKPRDPKENIITKAFFIRMLILAHVMGGGALFIYLFTLDNDNFEYARTVTFTMLAVFQWANAFNARSETQSIFQIGLFSNKWILIANAIVMVLQLGVIYTPFGNKIFGTVPIELSDWGLIIAISFTILIADELRKFILRKRSKNRY
jgi:P-type Ca2+ transporter type 2C